MSTVHSRRRRFLAVGLVALAAALLLGMTLFGNDLGLPGKGDTPAAEPNPWEADDYVNSGTPGDTDNDGEVSKPEAAILEATEASVEQVRKVIAPTKGGDTVLLTPGGKDWWAFVTSQAPGLGMKGAPAPDTVEWYAYTEGRTFKSLSDVNAYYQGIHVAFADAASAAAWVEGLTAGGHGATSMFALRGRVVTITPSWVDAFTEPYPDVDDEALDTIEAQVGLWQVDFTEQAENRAREASDPIAYADFWDATGISGTWTATSPRPDVPWVGTLDGFDASKVSVEDAAAHINTSYYLCAEDRECRGEMGISEASADLYMADPTGAGFGEPTLAPAEVADGMPEGLALVLVLDDQFRGMVNESYSLNGVPKTEYLVTVTGTLTLRFTFTAPETPAPDGTVTSTPSTDPSSTSSSSADPVEPEGGDAS